MVENWKDIPGYESYYQISNLGAVKSLDRVILCKNGVEKRFKGVTLKVRHSKLGYKHVQLYDSNRKVKNKFIHRLVGESFIPNPRDKPYINHKDSNSLNNNIENLEWCTQSENVQHGYDYGNSALCENRYNAKMTNIEVIESRKKYKTRKYTIQQLADFYGTARTTMSDILNRRTWKSI